MTRTVLLQTLLDMLIAAFFLGGCYIAYFLGARSRDKEIERLNYLLSPEHRAEQIRLALARQREKERQRSAALVNIRATPYRGGTHESPYDWKVAGL